MSNDRNFFREHITLLLQIGDVLGKTFLSREKNCHSKYNICIAKVRPTQGFNAIRHCTGENGLKFPRGVEIFLMFNPIDRSECELRGTFFNLPALQEGNIASTNSSPQYNSCKQLKAEIILIALFYSRVIKIKFVILISF